MSRTTIDEFQGRPGAILMDALMVNSVLLYAVSRITLSEQYSLPRIGSAGYRAAVGSSEDTISLSALLIGPQRYAWKLALELLADIGRRGGSLAKLSGGRIGGLILVTPLTVRIDMQISNLTFTVSAQRRDAIEVSITLVHVPRPSPLNRLLDVGTAAAATSLEFLT